MCVYKLSASDLTLKKQYSVDEMMSSQSLKLFFYRFIAMHGEYIMFNLLIQSEHVL